MFRFFLFSISVMFSSYTFSQNSNSLANFADLGELLYSSSEWQIYLPEDIYYVEALKGASAHNVPYYLGVAWIKNKDMTPPEMLNAYKRIGINKTEHELLANEVGELKGIVFDKRGGRENIRGIVMSNGNYAAITLVKDGDIVEAFRPSSLDKYKKSEARLSNFNSRPKGKYLGVALGVGTIKETESYLSENAIGFHSHTMDDRKQGRFLLSYYDKNLERSFRSFKYEGTDISFQNDVAVSVAVKFSSSNAKLSDREENLSSLISLLDSKYRLKINLGDNEFLYLDGDYYVRLIVNADKSEFQMLYAKAGGDWPRYFWKGIDLDMPTKSNSELVGIF